MIMVHPKVLSAEHIDLLRCYGLAALAAHLRLTKEQAAILALGDGAPRFPGVRVTKELPIFGLPGRRFKTTDHERFVWSAEFKEPSYENAAR